MSSERYHKAAKDGLVDVLKEATRREANGKDADGMTPVLWAAFEGKLDALRLLVARGGEPDKSDQFGNTALHLSAAKGHMQCVDFLVKFGANIYSLDIDNHSAKDLAAINNRDDILRYLDGAAANLEVTDRKRAKSLKEQAQKAKEKRAKQYAKNQQKMDQEYDVDIKPMPHRASTVLAMLKQKLGTNQGIITTGTNNPQPRQKDVISSNYQTKFSSFVGGTISNGTKGVVARKLHLAQKNKAPLPIAENGDDFKVGEIEASGKRSVRSIKGVRRDSEILYVGTYNSINGNAGKRGKITDVFEVNSMNSDDEDVNVDETIKTRKNTLMRGASSQPDFLSSLDDDEYNNEDDDDDEIDRDLKDEVMLLRPSGLFDRPMLGSLAFSRSVTAALEQIAPAKVEPETVTNGHKKNSQTKNNNNGRRQSQLVIQSDSESDNDSIASDDSEITTAIERFLSAWGLEEYYPIFQKQAIDLDTLLLLTETDLKSLNLPLGPFRKLAIAVSERKKALTNSDAVVNVQL